MKKLLLIFIMLLSFSSSAGRNEFCAGFIEGSKAIKGDMALVPICPLPPITPLDSTDFREGILAGIRAAQSGN